MLSTEVLGVRVDAVSRQQALETIVGFANSGTPSLVVTLGVEMVMAARTNAAFAAAIENAGLVTCDAIGLLLASRLHGGPLRERVTGVELVADLAARSAKERDVRLFLLGGAGDTASRAGNALRLAYPGAIIAGTRDGYFRDDDSAMVAASIRETGANVLLAGLGFPKQELWLERWLPETGCGVGMGIGGSLDVYAGNVRRAPGALRRAGLEWAYRLVSDPKRWRRQLALPAFAAAALFEGRNNAKDGKT